MQLYKLLKIHIIFVF